MSIVELRLWLNMRGRSVDVSVGGGCPLEVIGAVSGEQWRGKKYQYHSVEKLCYKLYQHRNVPTVETCIMQNGPFENGVIGLSSCVYALTLQFVEVE